MIKVSTLDSCNTNIVYLSCVNEGQVERCQGCSPDSEGEDDDEHHSYFQLQQKQENGGRKKQTYSRPASTYLVD